MVEYNPEHKAVLDELILGHPLVRSGKTFGYPSYFAGKKMCICVYEQGVAVKLPEPSVSKLLEADPQAVPFKPMGKAKMREWVEINLDRSEDYRQYRAVFDESIEYVLAAQE